MLGLGCRVADADSTPKPNTTFRCACTGDGACGGDRSTQACASVPHRLMLTARVLGCPGHSHGTAAAKSNAAAPCLGARGRTRRSSARGRGGARRSSARGRGALGCAAAGDRGAACERLANERGTANQWGHYRRRQPAGLVHHAVLRCVPRIALQQPPELSTSPQCAASGSVLGSRCGVKVQGKESSYTSRVTPALSVALLGTGNLVFSMQNVN